MSKTKATEVTEEISEAAVEEVAPWETAEPIISKDAELDEPKSWFKTGSSGFAQKKQLDTVAKLRKERSAFRFWMKPDEEATIIFVDSVGMYINEHHLKIGSRWGNYVTCIKDFDVCEVCNTLNKPSTLIAYYTVIDTRKFEKKDGTTGNFTKCLFGAKGKIINKIEDMKKRNGGSLNGLAFRVKRYDEKDFSTGSDFEKLSDSKVDIAKKFSPDAAIPFDYQKLLAPPSREELASLGFGSATIGSVETSGDDAENSLFN